MKMIEFRISEENRLQFRQRSVFVNEHYGEDNYSETIEFSDFGEWEDAPTPKPESELR